MTCPSYSTVTLRLPYGLKLSSSVTGPSGYDMAMNEMY